MKILKRIGLSFFILMAIGILFRGWLYRHLVSYRSAGMRTQYLAVDKKLIATIDSSMDDRSETDIEKIIQLGLRITSRQLNFTAGKNDMDPNQLIHTRTAHCMGYASFFATTCNYLLKTSQLADHWTAKPRIGQLYFLGINIHPYFKTPFFRDHDFVTIENKETGEIFAVDPTVNDYLSIDFVTLSK